MSIFGRTQKHYAFYFVGFLSGEIRYFVYSQKKLSLTKPLFANSYTILISTIKWAVDILCLMTHVIKMFDDLCRSHENSRECFRSHQARPRPSAKLFVRKRLFDHIVSPTGRYEARLPIYIRGFKMNSGFIHSICLSVVCRAGKRGELPAILTCNLCLCCF